MSVNSAKTTVVLSRKDQGFRVQGFRAQSFRFRGLGFRV